MGRPPKPVPIRRPNPITRLKPVRQPTPIARQAIQGASKARRICPNKTCSAPKVEDGICQTCGTIVDESNIVAEVQFGENASGAAVVQGSFVSADQGAAKSLGPAFRRAGATEDREKTMREGKRMMQGFAGEHKISESTVNSGMQIFKLAAMHNFIQGRRMNMVAAVCLYAACRTEKPCRVMLIDFADSCGVNVFKLGHCFKALHSKVSVSAEGIMPVLPEDLIYRFATKLEFKDETTKIAETAVRLVHRMKLDWMVMGRRPSGVCGACLILAARMHNYRRTVKEVVYIVKVTTATIQKRLDEFKQTASSDLTVEEFLRNSFLESAHDPPSFYEKSNAFQATKKTRKRKRVLELGDGEEAENLEGQSVEPDTGEISISSTVTPELDALPPVQYLRDADGFIIPPAPPQREVPIDPSLLEDSDNPRALAALAAQHGDAETEDSPPATPAKGKGRAVLDIDEEWQDDEDILESQISEIVNDPHSLEHARAFAQAEQRARIQVMIAFANNPQKEVPMTDEIDDSEFADDVEVNNCLLSEAEARIKEQIWVNANKDWLRGQQQKLFKKKMAELGPPKATRKRKKKPRIGEGQTSAAASPADAAVEVLKERSWSRRINYDAIRGMLESTAAGLGSASTSRRTSRAGSAVASSVAGTSLAGESDAGTASTAPVSEVGNALLRELDDDDGGDLDDSWREELEKE